MPKENKFAQEVCDMNLRQVQQSYIFKLPRILQIRKFRDLYNNKPQKQLRIRYNVPIPIFSGMIDTLQADLDDGLLLKFEAQDPADNKAAIKANAAIQKRSTSMMPGAQWNEKFRGFRQEMLMTGRGFLTYSISNEDGYMDKLEDLAFEDVFFEPKGGGNFEDHLFQMRSNVWMTKSDLLKGIVNGIYNKEQVDKLIIMGGSEFKVSNYWDNYDFANRFQSLNLTPESNNYVGETMFQFVESVCTLKGQRWYCLFEAFSGIWIRFEKWTEISSSGLYPIMSAASHRDKKNFASKGFADDLYPVAVAMTDMLNEDLENRKRRNSNAKGYDKDMFPNIQQLDQAQMGRDRLVMMDTKGGTRRMSEGIYQFTTPEITGTIDVLQYLESTAGRNFGVTDLQQGASQEASKAVGVTYQELGQVAKRLAFQSQPFIEVGQQLGVRFFGGLKDYLREPMAIKILGEDGYQWDFLKRIDLNVKKDFEISVTSQARENSINEMAKANKEKALTLISTIPPNANPGVNFRMRDEYILRDVGRFTEAEVALLLDPSTQADKTTISETSAAIQDLMMGRMPEINYNATAYFLQKIKDFVQSHQGDPKIKKNFQKFMNYIQQHVEIASNNEILRAKKQVQKNTNAIAQLPGGMANPLAQQQAPEQNQQVITQ